VSLVVIGALVQGCGFVLAIYQHLSTRHREIPDTRWIFPEAAYQLSRGLRWSARRLRANVVRILRAVGIPVRTVFSDALEGRVSPVGIVIEGHVVRGGRVEERVSHVEEDLAKVEREMHAVRARLEGKIDETVAGLEQSRKAELRRSLTLQELGILAFVVGAVLTTWGAV
jgi:hypothetical protein